MLHKILKLKKISLVPMSYSMNKFIASSMILLLSAPTAFACYNDFECGYGNKCIKPQGSINVTGVCITPSNPYGQATPDYRAPNASPSTVSGCSFDTECPIGFSCVKRSGDLKGICVR